MRTVFALFVNAWTLDRAVDMKKLTKANGNRSIKIRIRSKRQILEHSAEK